MLIQIGRRVGTDAKINGIISGFHINEGLPLCSFFFLLFRAVPAAYGGSQARGLIGAPASGLHHSHSNARSQPCLRPTPQLTATPDP